MRRLLLGRPNTAAGGSKEERQNARRVPCVKTLRRALHLTQEEFASRFRIPLGTLRDWEQGRSEPDQTARGPISGLLPMIQKL